MTAKKDRVGKRYGRLVVLAEAFEKTHPSGDVSIYWECQCDCGVVKAVSGKALGSGIQVSCGCYNLEKAAIHNRKHGMVKSPEYKSWAHIIDRCTNSNNGSYDNYGGRGITICSEWRHDFEAFYAHVGPKPVGSYSIDRINNNRGYEPGNVRWATPLQQANNKRRQKARTVCIAGHVFTPDNTYVQPSNGHRQCKTCRDRREAERQVKRRRSA